MAHQIENNQFAYKGLPAWHGLGHAVPANATGLEMLKIAGLDWRVNRRALAMRGLDGRMITDKLEGFKAITRSDTDHVFQVATDRYQTVQNQDIVEFFKEFCDAGHADMETVGALRDGAVIWALAKLSSTSSTIMGDDKLEGRLLLATSHDASIPTIAKATEVRVVCGNTIQMAFKDGKPQYRLKHSTKFGQVQKDQAQRVMGMASIQVQKLNDLASKLAQATIDHDGWMQFITSLLGEDKVLNPKTAELTRLAQGIQDSTMTSPGSALKSARGTMWGAVNGVTHYVDHANRSRSESNRLFSAWFGTGESMKNTAIRIAADMAGITL